jgi:hypothetical protein
MKHPPYHLRPNKAVDRLLFVEAVRRLERIASLADYTYYGLGGPYLEDFSLLYGYCPQVKMVSIEENEETYKRQQFHLPCGTLRLERAEFRSFLAGYEANDAKSIFWLDYTRLEYGNFEDFMALLGKVAEKSMVKITLRGEPRAFFDSKCESVGGGAERFRHQFGLVMPDPGADPPRDVLNFAALLQEMVQVASQKALPSALPVMFQPLASFQYADAAPMFTLTGIVCRRDEAPRTIAAFRDLQFANFTWEKPRRIDVALLSTKERLHLQRLLPCEHTPGKALREALGYLIDENKAETERKLRQYADFHRYYPYFLRAVP